MLVLLRLSLIPLPQINLLSLKKMGLALSPSSLIDKVKHVSTPPTYVVGIPVVDKPLLFRLFLLLRYVLPQQGSPSAESTESIEPN